MSLSTIDGASPGSIRDHNRGLVMRRVFEAGRISRTQIAIDTGLTTAAISRITRELLELKLLHEGSQVEERGRPGRRSVELSLDSSGAFVVGIGAGAFEQWVRLATLSGKVVTRRALKLVGLSETAAARAIVRNIESLLKQNIVGHRAIIACGAAIAGVVDPKLGEVVASPNFGWKNFPLASILTDELDIMTTVESLHHALNLAEASLGQTVGVTNVLLVNAALGIGGSILADGRLIRGGTAAAGQIGHLPVEGVREVCTCGRRGCLDTIASGHAVLTRLKLIPTRKLKQEHQPNDPVLLTSAMNRATAGDSAAVEAFTLAGANLGKALAGIRMVTDPARIVLTGPLARVPSYVEGAQRAFLNSKTIDEPLPQLLVSNQQNDAAGAWIALDRYVFSEHLDPATFRLI